MKDGFIKVCAGTPTCALLNPLGCAEEIINSMQVAKTEGVCAIVFPELALVGYTAGDMVFHTSILNGVEEAINKILEASVGANMVVVVGAPIRSGAKIYDAALVIFEGGILGAVPSANPLKGYAVAQREESEINILGTTVPFGGKICFKAANMCDFTFAVAVGKDVNCLKTNANIIFNPNAGPELCGYASQIENTIKAVSMLNSCAVVTAFAGYGESTTDSVFAGRRYIAELGEIKASGAVFTTGNTSSCIDLAKCNFLRFKAGNVWQHKCREVNFEVKITPTELSESDLNKLPFIPTDDENRTKAFDIINVQAMALARRMEVCHSTTAVVGISGGLDSTLALLVTVEAVKILGLPTSAVHGITMPCFGTTSRTKDNAVALMNELGVTSQTVSIKESVALHLKDINHQDGVYNAAYENAQARERTQVLMDIANDINGIVVGTGDLSELALGWATYNGDHMSMYGVNAGISKTLVQYLVRSCAEKSANSKLRATLTDILDTEISPELLPPDKSGKIAQKTEDKVGPYILHDYFLYNLLKNGYAPSKILRTAKVAFKGMFEEDVIKKWLVVFIKRFFTQQFKRSCLPDGPQVMDISLSPRGAFAMPSDSSAEAFLQELERNSDR